jgi:hypothetical protein
VTTVRTPLPAGTMAVPTARRATADALRGWLVSDRTREIAELVVSELVGNAVEHGGGGIEIVLALVRDTLRIDVIDSNPGEPVVLSPEPFEDRHRGLLIVAALSNRWGTKRLGHGKTVWAELPVVQAIEVEASPAQPPTQRTRHVGDRSMSG